MFSVFIVFFGGIYVAFKVISSMCSESKAKIRISDIHATADMWSAKNTDEELEKKLIKMLDDNSNIDLVLCEVNSALDDVGYDKNRVVIINMDHYNDLLSRGKIDVSKVSPGKAISKWRDIAVTIMLANRGKVRLGDSFFVGDICKNDQELALAKWVEETANSCGANVRLINDRGTLRWDVYNDAEK